MNLFDVERTWVREISGVTPQISDMVLDHFFSLSFVPYLSISNFISLFDLADERFMFGHNVVYIHYTIKPFPLWNLEATDGDFV